MVKRDRFYAGLHATATLLTAAGDENRKRAAECHRNGQYGEEVRLYELAAEIFKLATFVANIRQKDES